MTAYSEAGPVVGTSGPAQGGSPGSEPPAPRSYLRFRHGISAWQGMLNGEVQNFRLIGRMEKVDEQVRLELVRDIRIQRGPAFDYLVGMALVAIGYFVATAAR